MKYRKKSTFKMILEFDDEDSAKEFSAYWLDGGGDGGGNLDWHTCYEESYDWTKGTPKSLRIKGTGLPLDERGNLMDENYFSKKLNKIRNKYKS